MKKGIMAMEGLEDDIIEAPEDGETVSDEAIEGDAAEARADVAETDSAGDAIEEAESIGDALDANIERVEDKVSREEPLSEDAAEAIEVAVEHFRKRLGYDKKVVPSLEGFKSTDTSLDKTKELLGNLKEMRSALTDGTTIAQEGLFARMTNAIERWFTSTEKVYKNIGPAAAEMKRQGVVDGVLKDAAWGRIFAKAGRVINAGNVSDFVHNVEKQKREALPILKQISDRALDIGNAIRNNNLVSSDKDVAEIKQLQVVAEKLLSEIKEKIEEYSKDSVDAKPLSLSEADKLVSEVRTMMENSSFSREVDHLASVLADNTFSYVNQKNWRANGIFAGDLRAYSEAMGMALRPAAALAHGLVQAEYLIAYGVYKYIKASTK